MIIDNGGPQFLRSRKAVFVGSAPPLTIPCRLDKGLGIQLVLSHDLGPVAQLLRRFQVESKKVAHLRSSLIRDADSLGFLAPGEHW